MKESVLDVLMFLFEHYMDEDSSLHSDPEILKDQLSDAGFMHNQIHKAFTWLHDLAQGQEDNLDGQHPNLSLRIYNDQESRKLDADSRGFLQHLENLGIMNFPARELIIDRALALESDEIQLEQLKWVVLMVLFNRPGFEEAYSWMENVVLNETPRRFH